MLHVLTRPRPWDVVVVGSGATGGWAAHQLARAGLSVLVLEAGPDGPDLPSAPARLPTAVKRRFDDRFRRRPVQRSCPSYWELDPDLFVADDEHPYTTPAGAPFHWIRSRGVNGRMLTWGGICVRVSDLELRAPEADGFGPRWPIGYDDLAPHFDEIDRHYPILGNRDGLAGLPDGHYVGAPTLTASERRFRDVVEARFTGRRVIASRGVLVRPSSRPNGEAGPASLVRTAVQRHGATLRTDAVVTRVLVARDGRATGVAFVDRLTRRTHEIAARAVALCGSTLESTRILLNSGSAEHPGGLGNSSGALGRYLMDHPGVTVSGFLPGDRDTPWYDGYGGPKNIIIPRYHNLANRGGGEFLRGFGIFGGIGRHASSARLEDACEPDEVPFTLVGYGEMLPRRENHVRLRRDVVDAWGVPTLRVDCTPSATTWSARSPRWSRPRAAAWSATRSTSRRAASCTRWAPHGWATARTTRCSTASPSAGTRRTCS